jgi:hypothetical protein
MSNLRFRRGSIYPGQQIYYASALDREIKLKVDIGSVLNGEAIADDNSDLILRPKPVRKI